METTMNKPKILVVTRTPKDKNDNWVIKPEQITETYCASINVSDSQCATFDLQKLGFPSFWFPINEIGVWGHAPFFGALQVVNEFYKGDKPVHIHCHAGANRSPSIAYAILRSKGFTPEEAEESLNYENLHKVFERNHVPKNIIEFLQLSDENKELNSVSLVLRNMDLLYDEWAQKKFDEQNNYTLKANSDLPVRLIYSKDKKRFIVVKE